MDARMQRPPLCGRCIRVGLTLFANEHALWFCRLRAAWGACHGQMPKSTQRSPQRCQIAQCHAPEGAGGFVEALDGRTSPSDTASRSETCLLDKALHDRPNFQM